MEEINEDINIKELCKLMEFPEEPIVRIGLETGNKNVDYRLHGIYNLVDEQNNILLKNVNSGLKWRVKILESAQAKFHYSLFLKEFFNEESSYNEAALLRKKGYNVRIRKIGYILRINNSRSISNIRYQLLCGEWDKKNIVEKEIRKFRDIYDCKIIEEKVAEPWAKLEFFDSEYDNSAEIMNELRLIPLNGESYVTIYNIQCTRNNHNGRKEERKLKGEVNIIVDNKGDLTVVSVLPLEEYIAGLIPSMMESDFPLESMKAQAVASRSKIISSMGLRHLNDRFDFCSSKHCEVYNGICEFDGNVRIATNETRGQVLMLNGKACDAVYNSVCGGHTEDYYNIWESPNKPYLAGIFDSKVNENYKFNGPLNTEEKVRNWINSRPDVHCNLKGKKITHSLDDAKKYFRWEITYSRRELEKLIKRKTNEDIGILYEILPRKRGISGRLKEIEILGSHKNIIIRNENFIRFALSDDFLNSSCFIIEREIGDDGTPISFSFIGAGAGHGVGMCQTGAVVMADGGMLYRDILKHFYRNINIEIIY